MHLRGAAVTEHQCSSKAVVPGTRGYLSRFHDLAGSVTRIYRHGNELAVAPVQRGGAPTQLCEPRPLRQLPAKHVGAAKHGEPLLAVEGASAKRVKLVRSGLVAILYKQLIYIGKGVSEQALLTDFANASDHHQGYNGRRRHAEEHQRQ